MLEQEPSKFIGYTPNQLKAGSFLAVFEHPTGGRFRLQKWDVRDRLHNLQALGFPHDQTSLALELWPKSIPVKITVTRKEGTDEKRL